MFFSNVMNDRSDDFLEICITDTAILASEDHIQMRVSSKLPHVRYIV